jgi:hypothetical protein
MHTRPLSLSDDQLDMIRLAAETLPPLGRTEFLERVASHLGAEPTDHAVQCAIDAQLAVGRLPVFLCDSSVKGVSR